MGIFSPHLVRVVIISYVFFLFIALTGSFIELFFLSSVDQQRSVIDPPSAYLNSNSPPKPLIIAHRGSRYLRAENTIDTHRMALQMGADVLEFDVTLTKDNKLAVIHDSDVTRTTNGNSLVSELTLAEIKLLDAGYRFSIDNQTYPLRGEGLQIPELDEFLTAFPKQWMNIEIKDDNIYAAKKLLEYLESSPTGTTTNQYVVISSRWCAPLQHFRKITNNTYATGACESEVTLFYLLVRMPWLGSLLQYFSPSFTRFPAKVYQIPTMSGSIDFLLPGVIKWAHRFHQEVQYWVINRKESIEYMMDTFGNEGVNPETLKLQGFGGKGKINGIFTDRPDVMYQVLAERGLRPKNNTAGSSKYGAKVVNFIPKDALEEIHTCVTPSCVLLAYLNPQVTIFLIVSVVSIIIALLYQFLAWISEIVRLIAKIGRKKEKTV